MPTSNNYKLLPIEQLELNEGQLEGLPKNPRFIKDEKYQQLLRSIEQSPEFLEAKTLIVYPLAKDKYITIAGNMRLRACRELSIKEVPCYIFPKSTTIEKLKEFTIKDNLPFGSWDWDMLGNEWEVEDLQEWGMECDFLQSEEADIDDFFEEASGMKEDKKEKDVEITVKIPFEDSDSAEEIKNVIVEALQDYPNVTIA